MLDAPWALVPTVGVAALAVVLLPVLLRRLPEPAGTDADPGPGWAALAGSPTPQLHTVAALLAGVVVVVFLGAELAPLWWPLLTTGVAAAVVDARSTWIPRQLCWIGWAMTVPVVVLAWALGAGPDVLLGATVGAVASMAVFWLVWRVGRGGIGFGDVRVMPMIGLAAGSLGLTGWWLALLLGTSLGAVWAVLRRARGRTGPMAYAPALVVGPFLAAVGSSLLG